MFKTDDLAKRLEDAAEARRRRVANFRPKPAIEDPMFADRETTRAAALAAVRSSRELIRAERRQAVCKPTPSAQSFEEKVGEPDLRAASKPKVAVPLTPAEAKAKRDARYAARKARQ